MDGSVALWVSTWKFGGGSVVFKSKISYTDTVGVLEGDV